MIVRAHHQLEGAGFGVFRPFPTPGFDMLDPFLMLDEKEPEIHQPGSAKGAPDHPHRGFETVSYVLDGETEHSDSLGNRDVIRTGDVQWMTAGDGIVHSEMPSTRIQTEGGSRTRLPAVGEPSRSVEANPAALPGTKRGQAAECRRRGLEGHRHRWPGCSAFTAPAATHTPIVYAHLSLDPGALINIELPAESSGWHLCVR